ncbi:MAG TPA: response regulator [Patescibacteria group bacterium]|nr:response regulator [Patescibacteria group bacterium]
MAWIDKKKKILIVDDEVDSVHFLEKILRRKNYEVISTTKGAEAEALAKKHLPDIAILDIVMPDMEGSEVAAALRQHPAMASIPIILLSGMVVRKEEQSLKDVPGKQYVLAKPVTSPEIIEVVEKALAEKESKE